MSKQVSAFFSKHRHVAIAFPALFLYCGFIPLLKLCGAVKISWTLALAPVWAPFLAYWALVGFIAFLVVVTEAAFMAFPDKNEMAATMPY